MFCKKCGAPISDGATYCSRCGDKATGNIQNPTPIQSSNKKPGKITGGTVIKEGSKILAAFIVAMLIFAGIGYFVADNIGHSAGIQMIVHSTHITESVDVQFYVDGELKMTCTDLPPGKVCRNTSYFMVYFGISKDSKLVTVKAIATGGGLGTTSDSEDIIVTNGGRYTVDLYI